VTATTPAAPAGPVEQAAPSPAPLPLGALPIVTDQFATVTVVPNEELRRTPSSTLGDLLFSNPASRVQVSRPAPPRGRSFAG